MSRHFPDFLEAYYEYANDEVCPPVFHRWVGISILAGALERRVWIEFDRGKQAFPNLFVFLVAAPSIGKSQSVRPGRSILESITRDGQEIRFLADQMTEAAFYQQLVTPQTFWVDDIQHNQSASFLSMDEASNSLKEVSGGGSIISALTEFYDCKPKWSRFTIKDGRKPITNVCCNMLVGVTFNYLQELIPAKNILGGFASRICYVIQDEVFVGKSRRPGATQATSAARQKLIDDLNEIFRLAGPFQVSGEYWEAWEAWRPQNMLELQLMKSEKLQSLLGRRELNILKFSMIRAVSESSAMRLERRHWEAGIIMQQELEKKLTRILTSAVDRNNPQAVTGALLQRVKDAGGFLSYLRITQAMLSLGVEPVKIDSTLQMLTNTHALRRTLEGCAVNYHLNVDPKDYF